MKIMELKDLTQCKRSLDFKPLRKENDSLPSIAWNGYLLTGFHRTSGTVLNLTNPLPQVMRDLYPQLSFPELARFMERLEEIPTLFENFKTEILAIYHLKDHPDLDQLMGLVLSLPFEIQNYLAEKQIAPKELYPLRSVLRQKSEIAGEFLARLFRSLLQKKATRAQMAKAIELSSELFLMSKDPFHDAARTMEIWIRHLEQLRFPMTKAYDQGQEERLQRLPWPAQVQARWVRDGDVAGIEVKFQVHNTTELEKFLDGLERVSSHLESDLWKSH